MGALKSEVQQLTEPAALHDDQYASADGLPGIASLAISEPRAIDLSLAVDLWNRRPCVDVMSP